MVTGRVVRILAKEYHVETAEGLVRCLATNKSRRLRDGANKPAAVGDLVEVEAGTGGEGSLVKTLPRTTKLCRAKGSGGRIEGVLVANAEQVLAVFAAHSPDPDFRDLDKVLVMGEAGQMKCAIAINKVDLAAPPPEVAEYRAIGYPVFETCALTGRGIDDVRAWLTGRTTALMGPSGAGKSTLLNAVNPDWKRVTGELSARINEGRHTTTWVEMLPLAAGGWVVDTPGVESFGLWGVQAEDLAAFYPEMRPLEGQCRFRDCRHVSEPGCAIKAAVDEKRISARRWDGYRAVLATLQKAEQKSAQQW